MFLARVIGSVVSTKKDELLKGQKLLLLRPLLADEIRLEWNHARVHEKQRLVVRNQAGRRQVLVIPFDEEIDEGFSQIFGFHSTPQASGNRCCRTHDYGPPVRRRRRRVVAAQP